LRFSDRFRSFLHTDTASILLPAIEKLLSKRNDLEAWQFTREDVDVSTGCNCCSVRLL
jgi:hypothetical protein